MMMISRRDPGDSSLSKGVEPIAWRELQDFPLEEICILAEVDSTNDEAKRMLQGKRSVLVVAEAQRRGRGRHGRTWESPPGGLWFSLGLKVEKGNLSLIPILAGVAVAQGLRELGFASQIKWPNDILIDGKKVAGILVEADTREGEPSEVVIGIGINVNIPEEELQERVKGTQVGTLMEIAGHKLDLDRVLVQVLAEFFRLWELWWVGEDRPIRERWKKLSSTLNRRVAVVDSPKEGMRIKGIAVDLDRDGALIIRGPDGRHHRIIEGQVLQGTGEA